MRLKILIVDDDRIIRHLLELTFSNKDLYQLFEADCGEKAIPLALREKPDLIFLDVRMPGELNGFEICKMIKSWEDMRQSKIFLLSAQSQQGDIELGLSMGADGYITKPFSPKKLLSIVDKEFNSQSNL